MLASCSGPALPRRWPAPLASHRGYRKGLARPACRGPKACLTLPVDPQPQTPLPTSSSFPRQATSSDSRASQSTLNSSLQSPSCVTTRSPLPLISSSLTGLWGKWTWGYAAALAPAQHGEPSAKGASYMSGLFFSQLVKPRVSEPSGTMPGTSAFIGKGHLGTSVLSQR